MQTAGSHETPRSVPYAWGDPTQRVPPPWSSWMWQDLVSSRYCWGMCIEFELYVLTVKADV